MKKLSTDNYFFNQRQLSQKIIRDSRSQEKQIYVSQTNNDIHSMKRKNQIYIKTSERLGVQSKKILPSHYAHSNSNMKLMNQHQSPNNFSKKTSLGLDPYQNLPHKQMRSFENSNKNSMATTMTPFQQYIQQTIHNMDQEQNHGSQAMTYFQIASDSGRQENKNMPFVVRSMSNFNQQNKPIKGGIEVSQKPIHLLKGINTTHKFYLKNHLKQVQNVDTQQSSDRAFKLMQKSTNDERNTIQQPQTQEAKQEDLSGHQKFKKTQSNNSEGYVEILKGVDIRRKQRSSLMMNSSFENIPIDNQSSLQNISSYNSTKQNFMVEYPPRQMIRNNQSVADIKPKSLIQKPLSIDQTCNKAQEEKKWRLKFQESNFQIAKKLCRYSLDHGPSLADPPSFGIKKNQESHTGISLKLMKQQMRADALLQIQNKSIHLKRQQINDQLKDSEVDLHNKSVIISQTNSNQKSVTGLSQIDKSKFLKSTDLVESEQGDQDAKKVENLYQDSFQIDQGTGHLKSMDQNSSNKFLIQQAIETADSLITNRENDKRLRALRVNKSMNRYVKRKHQHSEIRNKDFVKIIMEEKDERRRLRTKQLQDSLKGFSERQKAAVANDYLAHQEKLVKIFSVKHKDISQSEEHQVGLLKSIAHKSEAHGDQDFTDFLTKIIDKDHQYRAQLDKLEDDVFPRDIQEVIKENKDKFQDITEETTQEVITGRNDGTGTAQTSFEDPTRTYDEDEPLLQSPEVVQKPEKARDVGGSQFLNGVFKQIGTENQIIDAKEQMFFGMAKRVEDLFNNQFVSQEKEFENDRAIASIEQMVNREAVRQKFRRQSTILNFTMKIGRFGKMKAKEKFVQILRSVNKIDKLGKEQMITTIHKQKEQEREDQLMDQRFANSSHEFGSLDVAYMANILNFKILCSSQIFKLRDSNIGTKYGSRKPLKSIWMIYPVRSEDFMNLIVIRQRQFEDEFGQNTEIDQIDNGNIESIFSQDITKFAFYKEAKQKSFQKQLLNDTNADDDERDEIRELLLNNDSLVIPSFAKIIKNELFLIQENFNENQARVLQNFLAQFVYKVGNLHVPRGHMCLNQPNRLIKKLVIDDCGVNDKSLSLILKAAHQQNCLQVVSISNCQFGQQSLEALVSMLDQDIVSLQLQELYLANLIGINLSQTKNLLNAIGLNDKLFKLRLSNINLGEKVLVDQICRLICGPNSEFEEQKDDQQLSSRYRGKQLTNLFLLDLSWASLKPKHLCQITDALIIAQSVDKQYGSQDHSLRQLNLSHNHLKFDANFIYVPPEQEKIFLKNSKRAFQQINDDFTAQQKTDLNESIEFVKKIKLYLKRALRISMVNFSGMQFDAISLVKLCHTLAQMNSLSSVHFSDTGLNKNDQLGQEILDIFGITHSRLHNDMTKHFRLNKPIDGIDMIKKGLIQNNQSINSSKVNDNQRKTDLFDYQQYLIRAKKRKAINQQLLANRAQINGGISRNQDTTMDYFVLNRKPKNPEYIFSLNKYEDKYFDPRNFSKWVLSEKDECYICDRHQQVVIFFDRDNAKNNCEEFRKIKNAKFKEYLVERLNISDKDQNLKMPIIAGSVCNNKWERKAKMIHSSLFGALCVSQEQIVVNNNHESEGLSKGICKLLETTDRGDIYQVDHYFKGWNHVIHDKITGNQYTDVYSINTPQRLLKEPSEGLFVFSEHLPAGHHQFIIYNPVDKEFYEHDFVLDLNSKDVYNDFPKLPHVCKQIIRDYKDVWRHWPRDTLLEENQAIIDQMFQQDSQNESFQPEKISKDTTCIQNCLSTLKMHYTAIMIFYLHLIATSPTYPRLQFTDILNEIQRRHKQWSLKKRREQGKAHQLMSTSMTLKNMKDFDNLDEVAEEKSGQREESEEFGEFDVPSKESNEEQQEYSQDKVIPQAVQPPLIELKRPETKTNGGKRRMSHAASNMLKDGKRFSKLMDIDKSQFLNKANIELAFIRAARNNKFPGIKGTINRGQFLDLVFRISYQIHSNLQQRFNKTQYPDSALDQTLDSFVKDYMMDTYLESELVHERVQIRDSKRLNTLLEDNMNAIRKIFEQYANQNASKSLNKGSYNLTRKKFITVEQAIEIFSLCDYNLEERAKKSSKNQPGKIASPPKQKSKSPPKKQGKKGSQRRQSVVLSDTNECESNELEYGAKVGPLRLRQLFHFSKMTNIDDNKVEPQTNMVLIEFVEMICRVALKKHQHNVFDHDKSNESTKMSIEEIVFEFLDKKLFLAHDVFPLDLKQVIDHQYDFQNDGDDKKTVKSLTQRFCKQIEKLQATNLESEEDQVAEADVQDSTAPIDYDIKEDEETVGEYYQRMEEIDQMLKKELEKQIKQRGMRM